GSMTGSIFLGDEALVIKTIRSLAAVLMGIGLLAACGPEKQVPEAPEPATQTTTAAASNAQRTSDGEQAAAGKGQYAGWGAHAGTTDILARLAQCNQGGHFFDRAGENGKGVCSTTVKVFGNCNSFES